LLLLIIWLLSLIITICRNNLWQLNDWNVSIFIFFTTISGTIFFINYITNKKLSLLVYVNTQNKILEIIEKDNYLKAIHKHLKSKWYYNNNDYVNIQREVFFNKDDKRVFEFIYRKSFVQIAVEQVNKFEKSMNDIANTIIKSNKAEKWWTSYYFVKIPYNKLDDNLVKKVNKIIDEI
jgi:hypothetical protein